jgi:proton glutamate symport protein
MVMKIFLKQSKKLTKIIGTPQLLIFSILLGIALGILTPNFAKSIDFIGRIYVDLLKLCVLPILFSAICISTAQLINIPDSRKLILKLVIVLLSTQFLAGAVALSVGLIFQPGAGINEQTLASLGGQINQSGINYEVALNSSPKIDTENPFLNLLTSTVPSNIFESLSENRSLQVVFFSILFGVALGLMKTSSTSSRILLALEEVYSSFRMIIKWFTTILPIGLFSLIAAQIAKTGFVTIVLMGKFVMVSSITLIVIYVLNILMLWVRSGQSLVTVLKSSKEYSMITMATSNSSAGMPSAIYGLTETLKFDTQIVNAVLPISIIAFRYGVVTYFTLVTVFAAQLYNVTIGMNEGLLIIVGSMFAALASSGSAGVATLPALEIVFKPIALPLDSVLVLLIAIDPVLNPLRATTNISAAMVGSSLIAPRRDRDDNHPLTLRNPGMADPLPEP